MALTDKQIQAVINYNYKGGDSSPIYQYFLSPFAQFCVDFFIPSYIAPNFITISGLFFTSSISILVLIVNPTLENPYCPCYLHLLCAISIFLYQTLDNMDGKQGKLYNNISP